CNPSDIKGTCELGDLAGIFGNMVGDANGDFNGKFDATFLSFTNDTGTSILDRSIVIHNADGARIACANITAYVLDNGDSDNSELGDSNSDGESDDSSSDTSGAAMFAPLISGLLAVAVAAIVF
ncbi:hypothetical protein LPJ74_004601, partial [Coemansia sp. RSA 1843]